MADYDDTYLPPIDDMLNADANSEFIREQMKALAKYEKKASKAKKRTKSKISQNDLNNSDESNDFMIVKQKLNDNSFKMNKTKSEDEEQSLFFESSGNLDSLFDQSKTSSKPDRSNESSFNYDKTSIENSSRTSFDISLQDDSLTKIASFSENESNKYSNCHVSLKTDGLNASNEQENKESIRDLNLPADELKLMKIGLKNDEKMLKNDEKMLKNLERKLLVEENDKIITLMKLMDQTKKDKSRGKNTANQIKLKIDESKDEQATNKLKTKSNQTKSIQTVEKSSIETVQNKIINQTNLNDKITSINNEVKSTNDEVKSTNDKVKSSNDKTKSPNDKTKSTVNSRPKRTTDSLITNSAIQTPLSKRRKCTLANDPLQYVKPINTPKIGVRVGLSRKVSVKTLHPELFSGNKS